MEDVSPGDGHEAYIRSLRVKQRTHLNRARFYENEYLRIESSIKKEFPGDEGAQRIKGKYSIWLKDAGAARDVHRNMANMYALSIASEVASYGVLNA